MPHLSTLSRLAMMAAFLAAPLIAQQLPLAVVDLEWSDLGEPILVPLTKAG